MSTGSTTSDRNLNAAEQSIPSNSRGNRYFFNAPPSSSQISFFEMRSILETRSENEETVLTGSRPEHDGLKVFSPSIMNEKGFLACSTPIERQQEIEKKIELEKERRMIMESLNTVRTYREDFVRTPKIYRNLSDSNNGSAQFKNLEVPLRTKREKELDFNGERHIKNDSYARIRNMSTGSSQSLNKKTNFISMKYLEELFYFSVFATTFCFIFDFSLGPFSSFYLTFFLHFISLTVYRVVSEKYLASAFFAISTIHLFYSIPLEIQILFIIFLSFFTLCPSSSSSSYNTIV